MLDGKAELRAQSVGGQLVRPLLGEVGRPEEPAGFVVDRAGKPDHGVGGRPVAAIGGHGGNELGE